jgi:PAS domain S-box-containing protein
MTNKGRGIVTVQDNCQAGLAMNIAPADCRVIFDAVSDAILIHEVATGAILDVNRGMCEMFGYTPEEARELKLTALGGSESGVSPERVRSLMVKAAGGSAQVFEWQVRDRAGRVFWVEAHLKPVRVDGRDRILTVLRDIDQRKQAEVGLKESEARYRMVTEGSLAGVYVIQEGGFVYVNPTMAQIFGYQPEEIMSRAVEPRELIYPDDLSLVREKIRQRLSGELEAAHYTFRGQHRDDTVIYCESFGRAVEYQGRPAIVGTLLDITERKQMEAALQETQELLKSVLDHAPCAVYATDTDGRYRLVNQVWEKTTQKRREDVIGRKIEEVFSKKSALRFMEHNDQVIGADRTLVFEETAIIAGQRYYFHTVQFPLRDITGKITAVGGISLDITERKQGENIRRQAYAELERLVAERTAGLQSANTQLRREIEERRRTEAIIRLQRDLGLTLSGKVGLHETLRLCVETGIIISGLDSGGVYLVNPTSGGLDLAYHQGLSPEFVQQGMHYEADDLNTYMVMAGKPLYARLEDLPGLINEDGLKEGLRSVAVIPVIHQDRVIASLNIASHQYEEVPATARAALETLAAQVGSAIARVQAEEALRRAKEELEIRVADRTAQLRQVNERLEKELRVRANMEQSLRQSEAKYRTLVEQIPAITYITSLTEGVDFFYVSPQIETLLGFPPGEWRAEDMETWKRQIHPDDRERVLAEITHTVATGEPFAAEYRLLAKSGRVVWFRDEARVVHDQKGEFLFLQGLALDITERKQAEEALRETTHTLQTLIQASPLAIIALDRDLKIRLWNPGAERTFGWRESEMLGRHLPYIPADQRAEAVARIKRSLAGEMHAALELRRLKKDGTPIDVQLWTASLTNARGEHVGIMGIFADITERKRAEEELRRQAELMDLAHDAIIVRDLDNRIVFWNSGAEETYGWGEEEARGQEIHKLLDTEFSQTQGELEGEFFRQGQWQGELAHTRRDGRRIVVTSRWALQRDREGKPAAILEINRDITEQKQAEAGRARLAAILEATSDLVGTADLNGRVLYLNRAGRNLLGIGEEEDVSRLTVKDLQPDWTYRRLLKQDGDEAMCPQVWSGETAFLSRRGEKIPTSQVVIAHQDPKGKVEFFSSIARDITESKRAAEALQEANSRLQTLVQASPLAIIALNLEGRVISWNPAAERMFGWRGEEIIGQVLPTIAYGQEQEFQALYQRTLQGTALLGLEQRRQRRDGSLIDVSLSTAPLHDGTGATIGTMGIIHDITARKRMEETLHKVSRALKAITECHQALIRATNETELVKEVCRIIVEVGGYRMAWVGYAEDDANQSLRPVAQRGCHHGYVEQLQITWADRERGRGPVGKAIRTGKPAICRDTQIDSEVAFIREEARKRGYASILALPLEDVHTFGVLGIYAREPNAFDDEEVNLLIGLANDLAYGIMALRARAEGRRAEEALKKSERELRLLTARLLSIQEQERRRVARELHDELGQALMVLKINLVAIEERLSAKQQHLKANCEQMLSYIDTVIENVRRLSWDLSPSSLEDLGLSSALGYLVDETCRNHQMQSAVVMDEIDPLFSPETQINIYRIFQESLTNVVKHARASLVSVKVKRENGKVSFMIGDNGRGFDLKRAMSRKVARRSLGLTAMNERALMAHGSLQISSRKGQGTTIIFTIPIR